MNLFTALGGIVITIPIIYFLRIDSIIWVILVYGLAQLAGAIIFRPRLRHIAMGLRQVWDIGNSFVRLGILITLGYGINYLLNYLFVLFLNSYADTSTLGIYQAGYTLVNTYVGVLFTGVWVEFYPRLASMNHSPRRTSITVSHQIVTIAWILMPVVALFIAADKLIVSVLYADTFSAMLPFITMAMAGVVIRGASWCLGHTMLSMGDGKFYLIAEASSGAIFLVTHVLFYSAWGFPGLGVAYILWYVGYITIAYIIYRRRYGCTVSSGAWKSVALAFAFGLLCVAAKEVAGWWLPLLMALAILPVTLKKLKS